MLYTSARRDRVTFSKHDFSYDDVDIGNLNMTKVVLKYLLIYKN